jgi:DNA-binding response OmpR family regulator
MKNKILVIEDDGSILNLIAAVLEKAGYTVQTCIDGKEGIETFRTRQFDLVA